MALLLEHAGQVVSRDEILASIWSETKVEFDQAINFCVRQIRLALGESAADPTYLETLPRRGYRFTAGVTRFPAVPVTRRRRPPWLAPALVAAPALLVLLVAWRIGVTPAGSMPTVAVVLPRHEPGDARQRTLASATAERLTEALFMASEGRVRIIGPATTAALTTTPDPARLRELGADMVVGGSVRFGPNGTPDHFFELIRMTDGAHVWTLRQPASDTLIASVAAAVLARMASNP